MKIFFWDNIDKSNIRMIPVKDIVLDYIPFLKNPSKMSVRKWLSEDEKHYNQYCSDMGKRYLEYTFKSFDDVMGYVERRREKISPLLVTRTKRGYILVMNGKHRWAAAYLLDVKEVPCCFVDSNITLPIPLSGGACLK